MGNIKIHKFVREWERANGYLGSKEYRRWYIVLPEWTGSRSSLEMVAGADLLLDRLAGNEDEVTLELREDIKDSIHGHSCLRLKKKYHQLLGGGADYYCGPGINNKDTLWLCNVTKFVFGYFPKIIWYRVIKEPKVAHEWSVSDIQTWANSTVKNRHLIADCQDHKIDKHCEVTKQVSIDFGRWLIVKLGKECITAEQAFEEFIKQYEI